MILDRLDNSGLYLPIHKLFARGFDFLRKNDLAALPAGRHEIAGDDLYAMVVRGNGKGRAAARLEAHRKYIDIQFSLIGEDEIGWRATADCTRRATEYDAKKDIEFFADASHTFVRVPQGHFAVFFPADGHAPRATDGAVHKIVVKIACQ